MGITFPVMGLAAPGFDAGLMTLHHDDTFSEPKVYESYLAEVE